MLKKIMIFSLLCFSMWSCIREDRSDCGKFRLWFRYTHNNSDQNLLASQVGGIRVYAFDRSTGVLTEVIDAGADAIRRGYIDVTMPDGTYTFVSWGVSGDDLAEGGYGVTAVEGVTTLDDFRLMLAYDDATGGKGSTDAVARKSDFDHLFWAEAGNITVTGGKDQNVEFDFVKNTSVLRVIVNGLEYLTRAPQDLPLDVFTTGRNYRYDAGNGFDVSVPRMLYLPYDGSAEGDSQEVYIKQQRLSIVQRATDPVMLYVRNTKDGSDIITPLDLVETILLNPAYPDQDAIDREDMFVIELSILVDLKIAVTVNGWEIVIPEPDIEW